MAGLTELADYRRLEAEFTGDIVTHIGYRSNLQAGERRVRYEEQWRRGRLIGQGGYGTVWLEEKVGDDRQVRAVKRMMKRPGVVADFNPIDEAVVMSVLSQSKNEGLFVSFQGWYETWDTICLVMEYVEHGDLELYLYKNGALCEDAAREIAKQVLEGLAVIHQANFIHRDVKPNNILIQHISPVWVKISDFGVSRRIEGSSAVTFTGAGTDGYKAPEIRLGERTRQSTAADMWSLGCVVFKLLTNRMPFETQRDVRRFCIDPESFHQELDMLSQISEDGRSFVKNLCTSEPLHRATAPQASQYAWIKSTTTTKPISLMSDTQRKEQAAIDKKLEPFKDNIDGALLYFVRQGDVAVTQWLIKAGVDVNKVQESVTPLLFASWLGQEKIVEVLIKAGAGPSYRSDDLWNRDALLMAVGKGSKEIVDLLLTAGADINSTDVMKCTPLSLAVGDGHKEIAELLIDRGADVNIANDHDCQPLHFAVAQDDSDMINKLMQAGADPTAADIKGYGPLACAVREEKCDQINSLINRGADVNVLNHMGVSLLHLAAGLGLKQAIDILLQNGAVVDTFRPDGNTALHFAAEADHANVINSLVQAGADVNVMNTSGPGWTPLGQAAGAGHSQVVEELLRCKGIDVNKINSYGGTALLYAVAAGHEGVVELLLQHGVNINTVAENGESPLLLAVLDSRTDMTKMLISKGADVKIGLPRWEGPLFTAARVGNEEIVRALIEAGADSRAVDADRKTPADIARAEGHTQVEQYLISKMAIQQTTKELDALQLI